MNFARKVFSTNLLLIYILIINVHKLFLSIQISTVNEIYDPDLINYYEPVANSLPSNFTSTDSLLSSLYAQVTPIFPIFLSVFQSRTQALVVNVVISFLVLILVYLIARKFLSIRWSLLAVLILSAEPSYYASSLNLAPEMIYSATLVAGIFFIVYKPFKFQMINLILFGTLIGISVLIRPIALILVLVLFIFSTVYILKFLKKINLVVAILLILPSVAWSLKNYLNYGFFSPSSISASNFLWYLGVPSLANAQAITFEEAYAIESERKSLFLGDNPSVLSNYRYNNERGLGLILEYPHGALISYLKGFPKIMLGIFKSKFSIVLNQVYNVDGQIVIGIVFLLLGLITLLIWLFFYFGVKSFYSNNRLISSLFLIVIAATLLPASGHIAYARFRSPIMPFVCIVSVIGILEISKKYSNRAGN